MSTRWRDEKWPGEPIKCDQCGLGDLFPIPMTAIFVPFWAIPEHDTPHGGGRCLASHRAAPDQDPLSNDENEVLSALPSDPRDLLTESQHTELRDDLVRLADIRKRMSPPPDDFPMAW